MIWCYHYGMTILNVAPHLDTEQLGQRYRQAQNSVERTHYLILWHLSQKRSVQEVSEIVGYSECQWPIRNDPLPANKFDPPWVTIIQLPSFCFKR